MQSPALLSTIWALVALYEVHRESHNEQSLETSCRSCYYEKGRAVLGQIETIYNGMFSSSSSPSSSSSTNNADAQAERIEAQIQWAKFGCFFPEI